MDLKETEVLIFAVLEHKNLSSENNKKTCITNLEKKFVTCTITIPERHIVVETRWATAER